MSDSTRPFTLAVIPARLASTRLPRKVLRAIAGKPMLQWIVEAAVAAPRLDRVVIATDSDEVMALAADRGWEAVLTSPDLQSGSDRVHAVSQQIPSEIVVNIQGDEPMLRPAHIDALLAPFDRSGIDAQVTTLWTPCTPEEIADPNAVKVVLAEDGRALYFSRSTIPLTATALAASSTASTSAYTRIVARRSSASPRCRRTRSKSPSAWNNFVCWRTTFRSTSSRPPTRPSASIPRPTWSVSLQSSRRNKGNATTPHWTIRRETVEYGNGDSQNRRCHAPSPR